MQTLSASLALREGNLPVTNGFNLRRASNVDFDDLFDVNLNKLLNKQVTIDLRRHGAHVMVLLWADDVFSNASQGIISHDVDLLLRNILGAVSI